MQAGNDIPQISPEEAFKQAQSGTAVLIDVREPEELDAVAIEGAVNVPVSAFDPTAVIAAAGDKDIIFFCKIGGRAANVWDYFTRNTGREASCMTGEHYGVDSERAACGFMMEWEFLASKIFWLLIAPANLIGICIGMAFICRICKWWGGFDVFFVTGCLLFFTFGVIPTGPSLLAILESKHQRPATMPSDVKGIIILGGAFDTYLSNVYGVPVLNDGVERVLDGITLAETYPDATLWFSGGSGRLTHRERTEAMDAQTFVQSYPGLKDRVKFEDRSRNTWQNAVAMRQLVTLDQNDKWIIVTSAYHMPRAAEMFWAAGWHGLVLWPTDYRTNGKVDFIPRKLDILGNLYQSHLALRELIGQGVFDVRRKLNI